MSQANDAILESVPVYRRALRGVIGLLLSFSALYVPGFALGVIGHRMLGLLFFLGTWLTWWIAALLVSNANTCLHYRAAVILLATVYISGMLTTFCSSLKGSLRRRKISTWIFLIAAFFGASFLSYGIIKGVGSWYGITIGTADGHSMSPAIPQSDFVIVRKIDESQITRGDVVTAQITPVVDNVAAQPIKMIKRITGIAGDAVRMGPEKKRVFLDTDAISKPSDGYLIPLGRVFLEGDNAEHSMDSRDFGDLPLSAVTGKVVFSIRTWRCFSLSTTSMTK